MRTRLSILISILAVPAFFAPGKGLADPPAIDWRPWSEDVFVRAQQEHRFVLLDLGTGWCHWCHVMEKVTYEDPKVVELIRARYVAVRVDADARPDLANRYEDYGWPATIVFGPDHSEIVRRRGYIPPRPMASMLQAIIDDPTPGPSVVPEAVLTPSDGSELRQEVRERYRQLIIENYDDRNAGWGTVQKFLPWDIIEYCLGETLRGDERFERMARETLGAQRKLIDPVWGGVYQYSTDGDWDHPHFEKIMQMQAENLRIYAQAYGLWHDPVYLQAARQIHRYLRDFLTDPGGAFYTSQDADLIDGEHAGNYFMLNDGARRQLGIPRVDAHIYARENGWAIHALAIFYQVTGDSRYLSDAVRAAQWILANRNLGAGGFSHDANDSAGPYLGDSLAMGQAFLTLYAATADRDWLTRAEQAMDYISARFKAEVGYLTAAGGSTLGARPQVDENVTVARFANLLYHYTGESRFRDSAGHAIHFLMLPAAADRRGFQVAGFLLADREFNRAPLHVTIVGRKDDFAAQALFKAALQEPATYKRIEWWDPREGTLPNPDVQYPELTAAAAFVCNDRSCSAPALSPDMLDRVLHQASR
ncbi:MAG: thioredoxin domain-containing protein [Verrucomicrobia bacterium]|nr:thioredoxin domain-containing protein [Verrucomicrobiota bacterium]